jgi:hypothetical protein
MKLKEFIINRYSLEREFISRGILILKDERELTHLKYRDSLIEEFSNELYHPLIALEKLREILETKHQSLLGCNGCRIDTSYRATGGYGTYVIHKGIQAQANELLNLFYQTNEIAKLCTVAEHKIAYKEWLQSLK